MSQTQFLQSADGVLERVPGAGVLKAAGTTVPSDGTAGYAPGCIFNDFDASAGSQVYINEGSVTSCDFNAVNTQVGVANSTFTGNVTISQPGQLIETDYDPAVRIWARSDFGKRIYSKAVGSDFTSWKSIASGDLDWFNSGNATTYGGAVSSNGGAILSCSNNSKMIFIKPSTGSKFKKIAWQTAKSPRFRAVIATGTSITTQTICVGLYSGSVAPKILTGGSGSGTSKRAEFVFTSASNKWRARVGAGGSSASSKSLGAAVAASTVYDLDIRVNSSRIPSFYINGTLVWTSGKALPTGTRLVPMIGIRSRGANKRNLQVFHIYCSRTI